MNQIERQSESEFAGGTLQNSRSVKSSKIIAEVSCDDMQAQLVVEGSDTVSQVRQRALTEMKIMAQDPGKYIIIGPDRQPVNDGVTIDEMLKQGQALYFRLIPQVAFGKSI